MMTATEVPSPCVDVCAMDAAGLWCNGCLRTLDEITVWSRLDDDGKRAVWALIDARRLELQPLAAPQPGRALP